MRRSVAILAGVSVAVGVAVAVAGGAAHAPITASTAFVASTAKLSLAFASAKDGRQHVAAQLVSEYGPAVYFATR